ncbi:hypothetical protein HN011_002178, partial [Eciton burchellii]
QFIPNFSKTAKPLTNLLKKDEKFIWTEAQDKAFAQLRDSLCSEHCAPFYNTPILQNRS